MEESFNKIPFHPRSNENNTHANIVDDSIEEILSYKINKSKYKTAMIFYILSFGIYYLIHHFYQNYFLDVVCDPCKLLEADYCVVKEYDGGTTICKIIRRDFFAKNSIMESENFRENINTLKLSNYISKDNLNLDEENIILEYRNNTYCYFENKNYFSSFNFDLTKFTNKEIHKIFSKGFSNASEYNYSLNKFGLNKIKMDHKSFLNIFIDHLFQPLNIYQIVSICLWIYTGFYIFVIIIIIMMSTILFVISFQTYNNYKKILTFSLSSKCLVNRKLVLENNDELLNTITFNSWYIVPGDIIEVKSGEMMPCDAIILSGYCNVNESDLTGESNLVMKNPLPNDNKKFSYSSHKNFVLFSGTVINKSESSNSNGVIKALVINTGFNTLRGNLIQNVLFPKMSNFDLYSDLKIFFIGMAALYFLTISIEIYFYKKFSGSTDDSCPGLGNTGPKDWDLIKLIEVILRAMTVIFTPALPISLIFTTFYFFWNLDRNQISCLSEKRMNAAGKVNILVLDKTGTLTEEGLDLFGFQITKLNLIDKSLDFDKIETDSLILNSIHIEFWKKFCSNPNDDLFVDYQKNLKNNLIYFIECLATCHNIDKIKDDFLGNSIDKKIFDSMNWIQEKSDLKSYGGEIIYDMIPRDSYRINESLIFSNNSQFLENRRYKLTIIKRFEFSSKFQSNSVIVKNHLDGSYRFFIKGAPEKIIHICRSESLPENLSEQLLNHTQIGYRVLACASRPIFENYNYESDEGREKFENDLIFLGFVVFRNKLKRDTKQIITKLNSSSINMVIATGDNPFTSISVARECGLIERSKEIFFCDLKKENSEDSLELYDITRGKEYNYVHEVKANNSINYISNLKVTINKDSSLTNIAASDRKLIGESNLDNTGLFQKKIPPLIVNNPKDLGGKTNNFDEKNVSITVKHDIKKMMENFKLNTNAMICMTGKALDFILKNYRIESQLYTKIEKGKKIEIKVDDEFCTLFRDLAKLMIEKGKIFSRMQPNNKVDLVNYFKEKKENIVAMCGDGANDCGALLCADIGISISHKKGTNITAHFYSENDSISCVEIILKNGRACLENSVIICKFMIIYGIIQNCLVLILYSWGSSDLTINQYLYLDCFTVLFNCLVASKTGASYTLIKEETSKIFSKKLLYSVVGHILIQTGFQFLYFFIFVKNRVDICAIALQNSTTEVGSKTINITNQGSYIFLFTAFQYIGILFAFNYNSKHRKKFYDNKIYVVYMNCLLFVTFMLVTYDQNTFTNLFVNVDLPGNYYENNEINRMIILFFVAINFTFTFVYENFIENIEI